MATKSWVLGGGADQGRAADVDVLDAVGHAPRRRATVAAKKG